MDINTNLYSVNPTPILTAEFQLMILYSWINILYAIFSTDFIFDLKSAPNPVNATHSILSHFFKIKYTWTAQVPAEACFECILASHWARVLRFAYY
jgi:hypothetical protein